MRHSHAMHVCYAFVWVSCEWLECAATCGAAAPKALYAARDCQVQKNIKIDPEIPGLLGLRVSSCRALATATAATPRRQPLLRLRRNARAAVQLRRQPGCAAAARARAADVRLGGGAQSGSMLDLSGRASGGARRGICMATGALVNLLYIFLHQGDSLEDKTGQGNSQRHVTAVFL